jgi:hypothetical protein
LVETYFRRGLRKAKNVFGKINPGDKDYEWTWEQYTLGDYCAALKEAAFCIETLWEPEPDPATEHLNPKLYQQARKYPYLVLIRAIKMKI